MSASLRDLSRRVDALPTPRIDAADLMRQGEARLRRRRVTAVVSATMAVVLIVIGAVTLTRGDHQSVPPLIDRPTQTVVTPPTGPPVREIVYSETERFLHTSGTIHFGDRVVDTGDGFVHMDVTDDGFVYTTRGGRVWFSDGGRPQQIGHACGVPANRDVSTMASGLVMTANAGSLVTWFDCKDLASARQDLVVFDTRSHREVARRRMAFCSSKVRCTLVDVTGEQVYFDRGIYRGFARPEYRFDVTTARLSPTSAQVHAEDIRNQPRGLVVGDSWQTGTATDGIGQGFRVIGSRLILLTNAERGRTKPVFDTATGEEVRLRPPAGYRPDPAETFTLFEWLDDNTVALVGGGLGDGYDEILTCRLSDGRCALAVKRDDTHDRRIVAHLALPG